MKSQAMGRTETFRQLLKDVGPMCTSEAARLLGISVRHMGKIICLMRSRQDASLRVHIDSWTREDGDIGKRHLRAVYALGDGPDAKKPRPQSRAEERRRYIERRRARLQVPNSVFALGQQIHSNQ